MAAASFTDLLLVLGVAATFSTLAMPVVSSGLDDLRGASAARYVATRLHQARLRAITRNRVVALAFASDPRGYVITAYEDGNRNGVLSREMGEGSDPSIGPSEHLSDQYPGIDFGAGPGVPGVDASTPPGTDPIRLGASDRVSFTPLGTATPGTLYLRGRHRGHYAVRVFGETGRTRVLKLNERTGTWQPI